MAKVSIRNLKNVYPNSANHKKTKGEESKANLQVTKDGVIAVQDFNLEIAGLTSGGVKG